MTIMKRFTHPFAKKATASLLGGALLLGLAPSIVSAAIPLDVIVNGHKMSFPDTQPFVDASGSTMVPVRFVSEALQAKVDWDEAQQTVHMAKDGQHIALKIGEKQAV